jgi:hypothetical protein
MPACDIKLLLIGIAPPFVAGISQKTQAQSATTSPEDNFRKLFILPTLGKTWTDLVAQGLFFIHAVKCAIRPKDNYQNPPDDIVNLCASRYFIKEINLLRPSRVVAFGKASYRALLKIPNLTPPPGLGISASVTDLAEKSWNGLEFQADGWKAKVHISPFPLKHKRPIPIAQQILIEAAKQAGLIN